MFVNLKSFQDFLSLLDGHFNQLHRFPVEISFIVGPFIEINKKVSWFTKTKILIKGNILFNNGHLNIFSWYQ